MAFYDFTKHQKTLVKQRFGRSKKVDKIPYQTCRLLILLGTFREKAFKSIKKGLGFPLSRDWVSPHAKNLINTVGNS